MNVNSNKQKGPKYLSSFHSEIESNNTKVWKGKLISSSGSDRFKIKYFGHLMSELIARTVDLPQLVFAIDAETEEEILLFDGSIHGYNGIFVDRFSQGKLDSRKANTFFNNGVSYEIILEAHYGIDYDDPREDFIEFVDSNGFLEIDELGKKLPFEQIKRNGFNFFGVVGIEGNGREVEILSEELS